RGRGARGQRARPPASPPKPARSRPTEHSRRPPRRKTEADSEAVDLAVAPSGSPLSGLLESENASLVRRVIRELGSERDREILLRFYIAEEDKDSIAADHGLTSLQFNRVLHRARQRYKELFLERTGGKGFSPVQGAIILFLITLCIGALRRAGG